jgi:hypothetical protein
MIHPPDRTAAELSWEPPAAPRGWYVDDRRLDGARYYCPSRKLIAIVSISVESDGRRWLHMSLSHWNRVPTWGELRDAKQLFLGDVYAYQVLPPKSQYVNINPKVLHLWHCLDGAPLPEFSRGSGSL